MPEQIEAAPDVLFIGKRRYTNRDALDDRYGRIWQLPAHWARAGARVDLWLLDYHGRRAATFVDGRLRVMSTPVFDGSAVRHAARIWLRRKGAARIVVASGDPYIGLLGYRIAKGHGARFVFDVYDKYDEFPGYFRVAGFDAFKFLLARADLCLFASELLLQKLGRGRGHAALVPNGVDTEKFRPMDMRNARMSAGIDEEGRYVGYFGAMDPDRGVADLVDAVGLLRKQGIEIKLLLGGRRHHAIKYDAPCVRYVGEVPYERMPTMLACCDILAIPYRRSPFMDSGASNKIVEAIASGRPVAVTQTPNFAANFPEQAKLLEGRLAEPGAPNDLARQILRQLDDPVLTPLPDGWTWRSIANRALAVLRKLPRQDILTRGPTA